MMVTKVLARLLRCSGWFLLKCFHGEIILLSRSARTPLTSGIFLSATVIVLEITVAFQLRNDFLTLLTRPAIKDDINFFLDFDFQPLYTFINCGFLLRTAHP